MKTLRSCLILLPCLFSMALAYAGEVPQDKVGGLLVVLERIGAKPNKYPGEGRLNFINIHCTEALLERATELKCTLGQIVSQPPAKFILTRPFTAQGGEAGALINALREAEVPTLEEGNGVLFSLSELNCTVFDNGSPAKCTYELAAPSSSQ